MRGVGESVMNDAPPPLRVLGLHHVAWPVAMAEDEAEFYCQSKGFERIARPDLGFPGAWLQKDKLVFHLLEVETTARPWFNLWFTEANPVVSFSVHDLLASASFFTEVLGLSIVEKEASDREPLPSDSLFEPSLSALIVATGLSMYLIGSGPKRTPGQPNSRGSHLAFGVSDIDAAEEWLKHCGATYIRKTQRGSGIEQIFLVDPDDHTLELNPSPMP
jgi:catechol 2,3-dioxygenase-like lactoylglutathione lyase family enzyme